MSYQQNACMPSITIRDVPNDIRDRLAGQAASAGHSLQEYLLRELIALADLPTVEDLLERASARSKALGTRLSAQDILAHRDADRR